MPRPQSEACDDSMTAGQNELFFPWGCQLQFVYDDWVCRLRIPRCLAQPRLLCTLEPHPPSVVIRPPTETYQNGPLARHHS